MHYSTAYTTEGSWSYLLSFEEKLKELNIKTYWIPRVSHSPLEGFVFYTDKSFKSLIDIHNYLPEEDKDKKINVYEAFYNKPFN